MEIFDELKGRVMRIVGVATPGGLAMAMCVFSSTPAQASDPQSAVADGLRDMQWTLAPSPSSRPTATKLPTSHMSLAVNRSVTGSVSQNANSITGEIGEMRVLLSASRSKRDHNLIQDLLPRPTMSNMTVSGAVEIDLGKSDSVGLFGNWTKERRKPVTLLPSRKYFTSDAQSVGVSWTHDDQFVASLARFSTGPSGSRTSIERIVDLAGGGVRKASGIAFTLANLPPAEGRSMTYGFDVRQQNVVEDSWSGLISGKNETIGAVFLAYKF
jgi:hypothetical protein